MFLSKRWTYNIYIYPYECNVNFGKVSSIPLSQNKETKTYPANKSAMTVCEHQHQHHHNHHHHHRQSRELQLFNRMQAIPLIELALSKSISTYARIKESHQLVGWALSTAESSLSEASRQAAPYAKRFEVPISYFDQKLCQGLDIVEEKVPIVKQPPALIMEDAYMVAAGTVAPAVKSISDVSDYLRERAASMKTMGWLKANEVLDNYYCAKAIDGLNNTASIVDALIDKYFPPIEPEDESTDLVPLEKDKLMRTLQTIGRLPIKAARRVYSRIIRRLPFLSPENFKLYMNNLLEFLRLASQLAEKTNSINSSNSTANGKQQQSQQQQQQAGTASSTTRVSFKFGTKHPASN